MKWFALSCVVMVLLVWVRPLDVGRYQVVNDGEMILDTVSGRLWAKGYVVGVGWKWWEEDYRSGIPQEVVKEPRRRMTAEEAEAFLDAPDEGIK